VLDFFFFEAAVPLPRVSAILSMDEDESVVVVEELLITARPLVLASSLARPLGN
jgi:hypothetical protein